MSSTSWVPLLSFNGKHTHTKSNGYAMQGESWTGEMEEEERIEERSEEGREGADFSQENASQRRLDPDFRNPKFRNLDGTW